MYAFFFIQAFITPVCSLRSTSERSERDERSKRKKLVKDMQNNTHRTSLFNRPWDHMQQRYDAPGSGMNLASGDEMDI
jgi:hypothetical protein